MSKEKEEGIVKTFRLPISLADKIELLSQLRGGNQTDIVKAAIIEYIEKNLDQAQKTIELIQTQEDNDEYMFIPAKYYKLFNNLTDIELQKNIKDNSVKIITLGTVSMVMVKMSESIYNKAESVVFRNEISTLKREYNTLKNDLNSIKREHTKFRGELESFKKSTLKIDSKGDISQL